MNAMTNHMQILESDRMVLRMPSPDDLPVYAAFYAVSDVKVGGYRGNRSAEEVAEILDRDIAHWRAKGFGIFLLEDKETGAIAGGVGLSHPDNWPSHELTWWLLPDARGKGFATEASRAVINWAHDVLGWPQIETHMRDENMPARNLALRLGGVVDRREIFPDGVTRDVFVLPKEVTA